MNPSRVLFVLLVALVFASTAEVASRHGHQ